VFAAIGLDADERLRFVLRLLSLPRDAAQREAATASSATLQRIATAIVNKRKD
jgi:hypothetical protein